MIDLDKALQDENPFKSVKKIHEKIASVEDMEGVVFVLDELTSDTLYLSILYISCHLVLQHHTTLTTAFELVSARLLPDCESHEAPDWLKLKVDKIQWRLNENKFAYRVIRLEKYEGLRDQYGIKSEISTMMNTHANA